MAAKELTVVSLIEKITRAKITLERAMRGHADSCPVEYDPEGYAPCNCGASAANGAVRDAIRELKLED